MIGLKKILYIPLLLLYLLSIAGVPLEAHFCGDKLSGVSIFETAQKSCCKPSTKRKKINCCNDVKVEFQVKDNHVNASVFALSAPVQSTTPAMFYSIFTYDVEQAKGKRLVFRKYPPPPPSQNRYLQLNVLLI